MSFPRVLSTSFLLLAAFAADARADTWTVRAKIDGRSRLTLQGATAQWTHYDWAAPGRLECDLGTPEEPTWINGLAWFPQWPDQPTCENRDCGCSSDVDSSIPPLPSTDVVVALHLVQCRALAWIVEYPSSTNGYRVTIEFDDSDPGGDDWYEVVLETSAPVPTPCSRWSLQADFRSPPLQANPVDDVCGNLGVWSYLASDAATYPARDPARYERLSTFVGDGFGVPGLETWMGTNAMGPGLVNLPALSINATGADVNVLGIDWPAGRINVHPYSNQHVVVGWRSPWTGLYRVEGRLRDLDVSCASGANGVAWYLDHYDGVVNTEVASGAVAEGGEQFLEHGTGGGSLASIAVARGEYLYLVVDGLGAIGCDSTQLDLVIRPATSIAPFCTGDGLDTSHVTPCPCANDGAPGRGCGNSVNPAGALLDASGTVVLDDVVLQASGMPSAVACIFLQGDGLADSVLADGVRCVGGSLTRLRVRNNIQGASVFPDTNETTTLSQRGGGPWHSGLTRFYSAWYRNASTTFCPPATANVTNGWQITW